MPLDVSNILQVDPQSLPAQGGTVRTTFEASAVGAPSRLRAEYRLGPDGIPYRLTGSTQLPATDAGLDPRDYRMTLTLQATGDTSNVRNVQIIADVFEVGGNDENTARGRVAIQAGSGAAVAEMAPASGDASITGNDLASRMKSFRDTRKLTQEEAADQVGTSRSTISRIENGQTPSDEVLARLKDMGIHHDE
jgi:DNA-binding XRE family transcriptional regulator